MGKRKPIYGVGINDADYTTQIVRPVNGKLKNIWNCPYYKRWGEMLKRCYSPRYHEKKPTYIGCTVCQDWLVFSNFKKWMEKQDWQGKHLDKDILVKGNKMYHPDLCLFVDNSLNSFMNDHGAKRGLYPIGVSWHKRDSIFESQISNPFTGKDEYLGRYTNQDDGHQAWRKRKRELAHQLADMQTDPRIADALRNRY